MQWLKEQEPEIVFHTSMLKGQEDWIRAGEMVFEAPIAYEGIIGALADVECTRSGMVRETNVPLEVSGVMPSRVLCYEEKRKDRGGEFILCDVPRARHA